MYISGYKTKKVQVDVNDDVIKEIIIKVIRKVTDLPYDSEIVKGNLEYETESHGGTHSWWDTTVVRKATKNDKLILELIKRIQELEHLN